MCDVTTTRAARGSAIGRPRWGLLYAAMLSQLAGLVAIEAVNSPPAIGLALRVVLTLSVFATMSIWIRANRCALDLQNWCACAGQHMTIRVVESRRPQPAAPPLEPTVIARAPLEDQYEVAAP
jgi:hypothetical protein